MVDVAEVFLWLMAVATILCASYWSAWRAREAAIEQDKLLKVKLQTFLSLPYLLFLLFSSIPCILWFWSTKLTASFLSSLVEICILNLAGWLKWMQCHRGVSFRCCAWNQHNISSSVCGGCILLLDYAFQIDVLLVYRGSSGSIRHWGCWGMSYQ